MTFEEGDNKKEEDNDENNTKEKRRLYLEQILSQKDFVMNASVVETLREYVHPTLSGGEPNRAVELLGGTTRVRANDEFSVRLAENYETTESERDDEPGTESQLCKVWQRRRREGGGERRVLGLNKRSETKGRTGEASGERKEQTNRRRREE